MKLVGKFKLIKAATQDIYEAFGISEEESRKLKKLIDDKYPNPYGKIYVLEVIENILNDSNFEFHEKIFCILMLAANNTIHEELSNNSVNHIH